MKKQSWPVRTSCAVWVWASWTGLAWAQAPVAAPATSAPASAPRAVAEPEIQDVEISGQRQSDTEQRRRSTASKIVVGREDIERFGSTSLGDILKRLPGVTVQGGNQVRMRGLSGGYTQILIDGERVQAGLSLDSLDPEQVERIEILRAPTAETGARAIAGTINIITRENRRRRLNDLKLTLGHEARQWQPRAAWSREDQWGGMDYNLSLIWAAPDNASDSLVHTVNTDPDPSLGTDRQERIHTDSSSRVLHARARLQWRGQEGEQFTLTPIVGWIPSDSTSSSYMLPGATGVVPYDRSAASTDTQVNFARLNATWRRPLGPGRLEWQGSVGRSSVHSRTGRQEWLGRSVTDYDDESQTQGRSARLQWKYSVLLGEDHNWVSGLEWERERRTEERTSLENGVPASTDFGANYQAQVNRVAGYVQDEWSLTRQWAAHAGLRGEVLQTQGERADGAIRNRSEVWSPMVHLLWKPEPRSRDQVRLSLTRSYRSPDLSQLTGASWSSKGTNSPTNPDRQGNPDLRPELATGLDLALEHYLPQGGMLSVSVFERRLSDYIRTLVTATPQADGSLRYVSQPLNQGRATTRGIEMEAKFNLRSVWADATDTDVRFNLSLYRSRVDGVAGPDNRLDQQADGTLNIGVDHKLGSVMLGGNYGYTPGYTTRLSDSQWAVRNGRRSLDVYAQWQARPDMRWRLSASNLLARDHETSSLVGTETATTLASTFPQWRLQLEFKL
jgi:outer membrane receptor for ferrienterochelin and colicins